MPIVTLSTGIEALTSTSTVWPPRRWLTVSSGTPGEHVNTRIRFWTKAIRCICSALRLQSTPPISDRVRRHQEEAVLNGPNDGAGYGARPTANLRIRETPRNRMAESLEPTSQVTFGWLRRFKVESEMYYGPWPGRLDNRCYALEAVWAIAVVVHCGDVVPGVWW